MRSLRAKAIGMVGVPSMIASIASLFIALASDFNPTAIVITAAVTVVVFAYVVFVPNKRSERNVIGNLEIYKRPGEVELGMIICQRGDVSFLGSGRKDLAFAVPFLSTPKIEIINAHGHRDAPTATTTRYKISLQRKTERPSMDALVRGRADQFQWVAEGPVLRPATLES